MDHPAPALDQRAHSHRISIRSWGMLVAAVIVYAVTIALHMGAYAGGSDSSGYLNNARLLNDGHFHLERRAIETLPPEQAPSPFTYVPLGFLPVNQSEMVPTYPMGLSLLIAGISHLTSWNAAPHVTMWIHAVLGVLFMFILARDVGLSFPLASMATVLLGASPLYLFMSVQAMSDVPSLVWSTAAMVFALRSRRDAHWGIAAGVATAVAVLVRPSDLLIVLPMAICLGLDWRRWFWLIVGGAPGAVFLALSNHALYGNIFATGYGAVGQIFSRDFFSPALSNYLRWLPVLLTPGLVLVFGTPWLFRREPLRIVAMLVTWSLVFSGFYAFYYHTHESWWYLRFILPAFPPLIITMLFVWRMLAARWSQKSRWIAAGIAATGACGWNIAWSARLNALESGRGERVYPDTAAWVRDHLPANAVVMAMQTSGALLYYTNFVLVRWDQFDLTNFPVLEQACEASRRPLYAVLDPEERVRVLGKLVPDGWTQVGAVQRVTIWKRTPETGKTPPVWDVVLNERIGDREFMVRGMSGWFGLERSSRHSWMWSSGHGEMEVETWPKQTGSVLFEFAVRTMNEAEITITQDGAAVFQGKVGRDLAPIKLPLQLKDGIARLVFSSSLPGIRENVQENARVLSFAIYDAALKLPKN